jgi:hypothetical protein
MFWRRTAAERRRSVMHCPRQRLWPPTRAEVRRSVWREPGDAVYAVTTVLDCHPTLRTELRRGRSPSHDAPYSSNLNDVDNPNDPSGYRDCG